MKEAFKIPVISPWFHIKKKQPHHTERVLIYCPKVADKFNNPHLGFQFAIYNEHNLQFKLEYSDVVFSYTDITYWARLTIDLTSVAREDKQTMAMFNMMGVKIFS